MALATMAGRILAETTGDTSGVTVGRWDLISRLPVQSFPGGAQLRWPLLVLAMSNFALRNRL